MGRGTREGTHTGTVLALALHTAQAPAVEMQMQGHAAIRLIPPRPPLEQTQASFSKRVKIRGGSVCAMVCLRCTSATQGNQ